MAGWIKLHRTLLEWEWYDDVNTKVLFIHLLLKANHEDKKWKGETIQRGELITGLYSLSSELSMSIQNIRTSLSKLEKTGEINKQSNKRFTKIIICKYDDYNDKEKKSNTPANISSTFEQQTTNKQLTTTKEVKKERSKEDKNNYKKLCLSKIDISDTAFKKEYLEIALSFQKLFKNNLQEAGTKSSQIDNAKGAWIDDIKKMVEIDKISLEDMRAVYKFLQTDEFWKANILSTKKLREKFPQLKLKMHQNGKNRTNHKEGTSWDELAEILKVSFDKDQ